MKKHFNRKFKNRGGFKPHADFKSHRFKSAKKPEFHDRKSAPRREDEREARLSVTPAETPGGDALKVMKFYGLSESFPAEVLAEAERIDRDARAGESMKQEIARRLDLRKTYIFTCDPQSARDYDDALSISTDRRGNRVLGVHIADVSHFVKPGSAIEREAYRRSTSVYLGERVVPMLPEVLCNGLCSLVPGQDRLTFSVFMTFNRQGEMTARRFERAVIRSKARFSYEEVMAVIAGGGARTKIAERTIRAVNALAQQLRARRFAAGALNLEMTETEVVLNEAGEMQGLVARVNDESHQMIEECMVAANEAVAMELRTNGVKFLARLHEPPEAERLQCLREELSGLGIRTGDLIKKKVFSNFLESLKDSPMESTISAMVLRSMKRAVYDGSRIGHYGLAKKFYAHFTSPIRRYPDLSLHRQLSAYLTGKGAQPSAKTLAEWAQHTSDAEAKAVEAERALMEIKKYRVLEAEMDRRSLESQPTHEAVIVKCMPFGCFVELKDLAVSGMIHISRLSNRFVRYNENDHTLSAPGERNWKIGDVVNVKVTGVDYLQRRLDFEPCRKK